MSKTRLAALAVTLAFAGAACGSAASASPSPSSAATPPSSSIPSPTATPSSAPTALGTRPASTATPTPTSSPRPTEPTPVVLAVSGRVSLASDGRPVAGVRLRFNAAAINGGCPTACPKAPGPDVVVTTDANGAYTAKVSAWTLEALADSSSSQLSVFVTPPAGMQITAVTQASTVPVGPIAPNVPEWYFMLERDLNGPIDITLAPR